MNTKTANRKKQIMLSCIGIILIIIIFKYGNSKEDINDKIRELQKQTAPKFDSLNEQMKKENDFQKLLLSLINDEKLDLAQHILDSLKVTGQNKAQSHVYQGMIDYAQNRFYQAIDEYNLAISIYNNEFPLVLCKRAEAYLKINKYDSALNDYRKAAFLNDDFEFEIGKTFELNKQIDSAILHYKKYLINYPQKKELIKHVSDLSLEKR